MVEPASQCITRVDSRMSFVCSTALAHSGPCVRTIRLDALTSSLLEGVLVEHHVVCLLAVGRSNNVQQHPVEGGCAARRSGPEGVHVMGPYSRVPITWALNSRTLRPNSNYGRL